MLNQLLNRLQQDAANWDKFQHCFKEMDIPAKTLLLHEGEVSQNLYFIKKGCLRLWFNHDGKDITFQFFVEDEAVSSIESFLEQQPSLFSLESIEPSTVVVLGRDGFNQILEKYPDINAGFHEIVLRRLATYADHFISRIRNNPQKRYNELMQSHPHIIERVPEEYIASYLGIPVDTLSRIVEK